MDSQGENLTPDTVGTPVPTGDTPGPLNTGTDFGTQPGMANVNSPDFATQNPQANPTPDFQAPTTVYGTDGQAMPPVQPTTPPQPFGAPAAETPIMGTPAVDTPAPQPPMGDRTAVSSSDVVTPDMLPESSPGEAARIHAALSHPYFSNHPSQTSASGVGDIVIDNRPTKARRVGGASRNKILIIGLVTLAVVGVIALVVSGFVGGAGKGSTAGPVYTNDMVALIKNDFEQVKFLETLFYTSQFDNVSTAEIFSDEVNTKLNQSIKALTQLKDYLDRFSFVDDEDDLLQIYIINTKIALDECVPQYSNTVNLYNEVLAAYNNGDEEYFNELSASEDENMAALGERFVKFFTTREYWSEQMTENNCSEGSAKQECITAQGYYDQNQTSLLSSTPVPRMLFSVYIQTPYSQSSLVYNDLELVIEEATDER